MTRVLILFLLLISTFQFANSQIMGKVIISENYGTVMSYEQFKKLEEGGFVKSIDASADTVRVTLKGPKIHIPNLSDYKRSYSANLKVNGAKTVYQKEEIPSYTPKSTQYNLSDSCFYLTFGLSPKFQTKGVKMDLSLFLFSDSIPAIGVKFRIIKPAFNENNPIMAWTQEVGYVAVMQVGYFPETKDVVSKEFLTDSIRSKRLVLSSMDFNGEVEVLSVNRGKHNDLLEMELGIDAKTELVSDYIEGIKIPLNINGKIKLDQTERADLTPCYFEIDYVWPEYLIPLRAFD